MLCVGVNTMMQYHQLMTVECNMDISKASFSLEAMIIPSTHTQAIIDSTMGVKSRKQPVRAKPSPVISRQLSPQVSISSSTNYEDMNIISMKSSQLERWLNESKDLQQSFKPADKKQWTRLLNMEERIFDYRRAHQQDPRSIITHNDILKLVQPIRQEKKLLKTHISKLLRFNRSISRYETLGHNALIMANLQSYKLVQAYLAFCTEQMMQDPALYSHTSRGWTKKLRKRVKELGGAQDSNFISTKFKSNLEKAIPLFLLANYLGIGILQYPEVATTSKLVGFHVPTWNTLVAFLQHETSLFNTFSYPNARNQYEHLTPAQLFVLQSYYL
ncbi:hypothetical protein K7432_014475 [Basidiobolus ranarum]|uniref:Uncharacterized protein n=1 Tax=Basidiobolus ranarum TaxID=34480 RepID=A0ABR2VQI2_9FUNG